MLLDTGGGNFAFHADVYGRKTSDYRIPSYPVSVRPDPARRQRPPAQFGGAPDGASIGGSYFFQGGYIGAAITQNDALYHIPGIDGADHNTRIDAHQTKINVKGEYRPDAAAIDAVRFWAGATDYKHNEIGLADPADPNTDGVRQTFTNKEQEGRIEVQLMPFNVRFAEVTTALGFQAGHQELTRAEPGRSGHAVQRPVGPQQQHARCRLRLQRVQVHATRRKAQIAGRIEHVELHGTTPDFPAGLPARRHAAWPASPAIRHFTPKSGSVGLMQNLPGGLVGSITAQYVERAPKPAELFSRGAHDATATFDIGNPNLSIETAKSVEVGLRRRRGRSGSRRPSTTRSFNDFIFRRLTGVMCDDDFASLRRPRAPS